MEQKEPVLALCDTEEDYAQLMSDYLKTHKDLPWEIHTYTKVEELLRQEKKGTLAMLVVAESAYSEELTVLEPLCLAVLNESGVIRWEQVSNIDKYQPADLIWNALLELYSEKACVQLPHLSMEYRTRFIGIYSPIRRCLQTSFALTMSQMLAESHSTLYLNFEHYVGITELLPERQSRDLADLLYFLTADPHKFRLRIQTVIQHRGNLDYIPSMKQGQNLLTITCEEWLTLLRRMEELGSYEYVILDLSDNMQGLFDILRVCTKVYTLTKEDRIARSKLDQYEQLLSACEYEDVLQKTRRLLLPQFHRLPEELEQYTRGDFADYVKGEMQLLCGEATEGQAR